MIENVKELLGAMPPAVRSRDDNGVITHITEAATLRLVPRSSPTPPRGFVLTPDGSRRIDVRPLTAAGVTRALQELGVQHA